MSEKAIHKFYPEMAAGGFSREDGAVTFYERIRALLPADATLVDFGAGRGKFREDPSEFRRDLKDVASRAARSIAVDVDAEVLENVSYKERYLLDDGKAPLRSEVADLIFADWTLEHVLNPVEFSEEIDRLLKPGGWFCARTPNKWGLVGIPTRLVPNRWHVPVLRTVSPDRKAIDTFPTAYKMNTLKDLQEYFPETRFSSFSFCADSEPGYVGNSAHAIRATRLVSRFTPDRLRSTLYVFLQKI